jgi:zinc transport system substrate-binding protein
MGKVRGLVLAAAFAGILAGGFGLAGCGQGAEDKQAAEERPLKVAATLFPYYDFTRQIAGDLIDLELIVPAGMDSHSFEPTPADMKKIQEADVVIINGGAMEHWVDQVLKATEGTDRTVVCMMDYVDAVQEELVEGMEEGRGGHEGHSHEDPAFSIGYPEGHEQEIEYDEHIWTSPVNAMRFVQVIEETLSAADPSHKEQYRMRREAYEEELMEIHQGFLRVAKERKRDLIVVGDKFPFLYLADEYGFGYRAAFTGCSTDTEPSARTIAYLIDKVREEKIPAVYYLELSSHRVTEIIGEETGAEPLLLHSCHNVTRKEFEAGVTYGELMRQNVENLRKGLDQ